MRHLKIINAIVYYSNLVLPRSSKDLKDSLRHLPNCTIQRLNTEREYTK